MTRRLWVGAAVVVGLQVTAAAATFTSAPHTGGDNAGYVSLAYSLLERGEYLDLVDPDEPRATKYPPVYPAVLAAAVAGGARTWTSLKLVSFAGMSLAVLLSFLWIAGRRGVGFALPLVALLAISEAFLWHSRWVLSDPLFLVFTLASLWLLDRAAEEGQSEAWALLGCGMAILAFFTRSAGLPLVLAAGLWLALERRWRPLVWFAVAFALPAAWWSLRARGILGTDYVAEFWLIDPYRPDLGTVGVAELWERLGANVRAYVGRWIPGGLMGIRGTPVALVGIVLTGLAVFGWVEQVNRRPRTTELFVPLYVAVILLWPVVWAGDRFALPLYPLLLYYGGDTLLRAFRSTRPRLRWVALTPLWAVLAVPAVHTWSLAVREEAACRRTIEARGVFACYPTAVQEYVAAAEWAGSNLSERTAVFTRKPRLFYVLSGVHGRVYPLTREPGEFLAQALAGGVTHVVMDYLDNLGAYYLSPVIEGRTGAFCSLVGFGDLSRSRTEIFGVLPPSDWETPPPATAEGGELVVSLRLCERAPPGANAPMDLPIGTADIPLLRRLDDHSDRPGPP